MVPLYSIGTWDTDAQAFTPQIDTEPCINVPWQRMLQVLRLLRDMGYSAYRTRHANGERDSDPFTLVERTDGMDEKEILARWER